MSKQKYVNLDGPSEVQIAYGDNESEIWLGSQSIRVIKMFGPTIFADLRITPVLERMQWVIERRENGEWKEYTSIPAQLDSDFPNEA